MPNIIRIKRSTGSTPPTQLKNAELAFAEGTNILYIGRGTQAGTDIATEIVKVGGTGAFMTFDTNQAPTGVKTFSTTTFKLTGGTNGQILTTDGSGNLSWTSGVGDAYSSILGDQGGTITASGATSLRVIGGSQAITVTVSEGTQDTVSIAVADASTTAKGVVMLDDAVTSSSSTTAATSKSVKQIYDEAIKVSGGTLTSGTITLFADPTEPMHAATRKYVDSVATGLDVKPSVRVATAAALPGTLSYSNGTNGIGATLSSTNNASINPTDGVSTLAVGQRILVKDQVNKAHNGIYTITQVGNGATTGFILTRAADADTSAEVTPGMFVFVEEGTRNAANGFVLSTTGAITIGSNNLEFSQFSGAGQITIAPNTGLEKDGNELSIGVVPAAKGGTGLSTYARGDILYAGSANPTALSKLGVAASGNVLISGTDPSWGKVGLTTHVNGTLPVANGGTGAGTLTGILKGNGTSAFSPASAGTDYVVAGTQTVGKVTFKTADSTSGGTASIRIPPSAVIVNSYLTSEPGDIWNADNNLRFQTSGGMKTIAFTDSNITGTAANIAGSGIVAVANGGTGASTFDAGRLLKGNGTSAIAVANAGTDFVQPGTATVGKIFFAASASTGASFNIPSGVAPTTPSDGDIWNAAGALNFRYGSTKAILLNDSTLDGGDFT